MFTSVSTKPPLKVRGSCPAGHVVETTADPGKVTKRLDCTGEGCTHKVVCRRVPVAQQSGPPAKPNTAPAEDDPRALKVKKVTAYHDDPAAYEQPPEPAPDGPDDDSGSPGVSGAEPDDGPPATEPAGGEPRARRGFRRPRRAGTAEHGGQLYPGIY